MIESFLEGASESFHGLADNGISGVVNDAGDAVDGENCLWSVVGIGPRSRREGSKDIIQRAGCNILYRRKRGRVGSIRIREWIARFRQLKARGRRV